LNDEIKAAGIQPGGMKYVYGDSTYVELSIIGGIDFEAFINIIVEKTWQEVYSWVHNIRLIGGSNTRAILYSTIYIPIYNIEKVYEKIKKHNDYKKIEYLIENLQI
jgi:arginine/lysine/ornithine decarboxylase